MSVNQNVFDSAIMFKSNYGRNIGPQGGVCNNSQFIIEPDGSLRVAVFNSRDAVVLKSSFDNGFTWSDRDNVEPWDNDVMQLYDASNTAGHGARMALTKIRDFVSEGIEYKDNYMIITSDNNQSFHKGSWVDAAVSSVWGKRTNKYVNGSLDIFGTEISDSMLSGYYASDTDNNDIFYSVYTQETNGHLDILGQNFNVSNEFDIIQDYKTSGITAYHKMLAIRSWQDKLHIIYGSTSDELTHISYNKVLGSLTSIDGATGSFNTPVVIDSGLKTGQNTSFIEPTIAVDASGVLCVHYCKSADGINSTGHYAISNDGGSTWSTFTTDTPAGYSAAYDDLASDFAPSNDVLGTSDGFLISRIFELNGSADLFIKEINADGSSTDAWHKVNSVSGNVIGGKFFRFTNEMKPSRSNKTGIRMAYQIGENNEVDGLGTKRSTVYQERIINSAYPDEFTGTSYAGQNIDYYAAGYKNDNTELYINKIDEIGMEYSFTRTDPLENATVNGRSAYGASVTTEEVAVVDPGAYGFPTVAKNDADFNEYIARDTRKMFFKANNFLDRNFVINEAGTLKRTIWSIRIMGNDYEIAQIVPRWLDGSIMYYEANLYVIGPSNDPFSKVILPSES